MKHEVVARRRATNVTLPEDLVAVAKTLGVNMSRVTEQALRAAVAEAEEDRWKRDNAEWIAAHRAWVEANELPLERYRLF